jgi:hypothetical protein
MSSNLPLYRCLYGTNIKFRRAFYILDDKKKVLDEFSTADEESEGTTESEVACLYLKRRVLRNVVKGPPPTTRSCRDPKSGARGGIPLAL